MASTDKLLRIILRLEDDFSGNIGKAQSGLKSFGDSLTSIGSKMTASLTLPIVGLGVAAVNTAMDFDKAMRNIQSITKEDEEAINELGWTFQNLSRDMTKTTDTAQNLAEGFYQVVSSGFEGADAMKVLEAATKAASAGLTTTEVAVEGIAGVLNAYALDASHATEISDIMFETVNRGVVTFEQLNGALGNVTGVAAQMGVGFDEIGAAIATMTKQNIDAATATTNLNGIMTSLIKPTTAMQEAIEALGYSSGSAMLETLGLGGTMQALSKHTGGSAEKMAALFGDVRALRGAMALTGEGASMFAEDLKAMAGSAGATQAAFAIQMKSFAAVWQNFMNTLQAVAYRIGDILLPILSDLITNYLKPAAEWFLTTSDNNIKWIIAIAGVIAVLGPLLIIIGQIASGLAALASLGPVIAGAFTMLTTGATAFAAALPAIGTAIATVGGPITMVIGLLGALYLAYQNNFMGIKTTVDQLGFLIGVALQKAGENLKMLAEQMFTIGKLVIEGLINGIKSKAVDLISYIFHLSKEMTAAIKSALGVKSPSKVFEGIGKNVVKGFNQGISGMGGLGVNVNGSQLQGGTASPSFAGASSGAGGGGAVQNFYIYPKSTNVKEIAEEVAKEIGRQSERRGAKKSR